MGKKMKFPFLSKNTTIQQAKSPWPWPSCHQPRTLSFRGDDTTLFKTINSAYLDAIVEAQAEAETPEDSWFSNSSESASFSTASDESGAGADPVESVIRGLRSERLFFEPGETSSILEEAVKPIGVPFKESVVLSMESKDPYLDFRKSMEEMVEAHGVKDLEGLEHLLCWYLRANGKSNHGYIVGAFVDLLVALSLSNSPSPPSSTAANDVPSCSNCSQSPSSPLSFYTSSSSSSEDSSTTPCVSSLEAEEEIDNSTSSSHCLSSLSSEADQKNIIEHKDDDAASSSLDV